MGTTVRSRQLTFLPVRLSLLKVSKPSRREPPDLLPSLILLWWHSKARSHSHFRANLNIRLSARIVRPVAFRESAHRSTELDYGPSFLTTTLDPPSSIKTIRWSWTTIQTSALAQRPLIGPQPPVELDCNPSVRLTPSIDLSNRPGERQQVYLSTANDFNESYICRARYSSRVQ